MGHCFKKFHDGNEIFEHIEGRGWHSSIISENMKAYVEAKPRREKRELTAELGVRSKSPAA